MGKLVDDTRLFLNVIDKNIFLGYVYDVSQAKKESLLEKLLKIIQFGYVNYILFWKNI